MSLVCLDTHILIWGIKGDSSEADRDKVQQAQLFLKSLEKDGISICVPSVVLGELLSSFPDYQRRAIMIQRIDELFEIRPYDSAAAGYYAELWHLNKKRNQSAAKKSSHRERREKMKADLMILATAKAAEASKVFSYDKGLQKAAKGFIDVEEMPAFEIQEGFCW